MHTADYLGAVLESIALKARRWTSGLPIEVALVFPVLSGRPSAPVAIEYGIADSVAMPTERVLRVALAAGANGVVIAHNHPGDAAPSAADLAVTRRLVAAGAAIGVRLQGHLVLTRDGWYDCFTSGCARIPWPESAAA